MRSVKQIQFMRQKPSGYHKAVMIGLMDTRSSRRGSGRRSGMFGMVGDTLLSGGYMDGNKPLLCALLNTGPRLTLHEFVFFFTIFFSSIARHRGYISLGLEMVVYWRTGLFLSASSV